MFKKELSRREAFKISSALGIAGIMARGGLFEESPHFQKFLAAIKTGSATALAQAAAPGTEYTLVQFCLADKFQAAVINGIDPLNAGTAPIGLDTFTGDKNFQTQADFRGMSLTKPVADVLKELPPNVSFAIANGFSSGSGGHSLANSKILGAGLNYTFETKVGGTGLLGVTAFGINSDANNSADVHTGPGGLQLATFPSVGNLSQTLEASVSPLKDPETNELTKILDTTVTKDTAFRDRLVEVANQIDGAIPEIKAAGLLRTSKFGSVTGGNMNAMFNDVVMAQANAVLALSRAGVCRNFTIGVPYDDTNGGGNLITPGNSGYDPISGIMKYMEVLVFLHLNIPNLVTVTTTDGGRGQNNGDQANGLAVFTGPENRLKNGFIDGLRYTAYTQLGNNAGQHKMSNGSSMVAGNQHIYATALKLMGVSVDENYLASAVVES